jgi:hypothetical protein
MTKDVNHRDENGMTPLLYAIFVGDVVSVRELLATERTPICLPKMDLCRSGMRRMTSASMRSRSSCGLLARGRHSDGKRRMPFNCARSNECGEDRALNTP